MLNHDYGATTPGAWDSWSSTAFSWPTVVRVRCLGSRLVLSHDTCGMRRPLLHPTHPTVGDSFVRIFCPPCADWPHTSASENGCRSSTWLRDDNCKPPVQAWNSKGEIFNLPRHNLAQSSHQPNATARQDQGQRSSRETHSCRPSRGGRVRLVNHAKCRPSPRLASQLFVCLRDGPRRV